MRPVGSILFEPNGPLMFRGPMEFMPTVRGPQALARTLPLPLPSTIAGCLATLLLDKGVASLPKTPVSWEDALIQVLELSDKACLRGPYLLVDNEVYIPFETGVIKLRDLVRKFREIDIKEAIYGDEIRHMLESLMIRLEKIEYVGIGLEKATKAVKRGLLYSAEFVDYPSTFKGHKVSIAMDVYGATALTKLPSSEQYIIRLGGEGRTVRVKINEVSYLWEAVNEIEKRIEPISKGEYIIYVVSPVLMKTPLANLAPVIVSRPKFSIKGIDAELLVGRVDVLGAGFDIHREVRKPMYASLLYGSLLKVNTRKRNMIELYRQGLSDVGNKLGYGTFIPLLGITTS